MPINTFSSKIRYLSANRPGQPANVAATAARRRLNVGAWEHVGISGLFASLLGLGAFPGLINWLIPQLGWADCCWS